MVDEQIQNWKHLISRSKKEETTTGANAIFVEALFHSNLSLSDVSTQLHHVKKSNLKITEQLENLNSNLGSSTQASNNHAQSMRWLTLGLVLVGVAHIIVAALP